MVEFKWIQISLFLIAVLQFTATAEGLPPSFFTVRAGEEVTLPCENVIDDQQNCDSTTWLFIDSGRRATVELIKHGQIGEHGKSKSDRLSVTQNCSLVIKKVTDEDAGPYGCQQYKSGKIQGYVYVVHLSVVTMTEHKNNDQVVLSCSVSPYGRWFCEHTVKWLFNGNNVDKDHKDLQTSQSDCSASVTFQSSLFINTSNSNLLKCEVTDGNKVQHLFPFRLQPSGEKPGDDTRTRKPKPKPTKQTKPPPPPPPTTTTTTTESSMTRGTITTASPINDDSANLKGLWWLFILVPVVLVALIITAVKVIRRKRATGNNAGMNDNAADPEGGVSYASVNFTKKPNGEGRVRGGGEDEAAVTYTTVKASSSSAGPSADSHVLYATINKPNK